MTQPENREAGVRDLSAEPTKSGSADLTGSSLRDLLELIGPAWRQADPANPPPIGCKIGRFEVIESIGSGGFGEVLRVFDPKLARVRAMKVPKPESLGSSSIRGRFFREARAAASLDHPNVVRVFEADEAGPICFLVMEYCPGGSLASWIAARPEGTSIPDRWAAGLVAQIADGVAHAHSRGILHRDLKPSNVLLVLDGEESGGTSLPKFTAKVADFGLAKILDEAAETDRTASDALVGTLAYMAPEQARRDPAGITEATDVYGLGTILHELLAGRRPFADLRHAELIEHIVGRDPSPLKALRPGLPADLDTICRKCLAKAPADRYPTAADLSADLSRWLRGDPIRARRSPLWKKGRAWSRRHPVLISMLALAALGLGGAWTFFEARAHQGAVTWLDRLEVANLSALPRLIAERKSEDPRVSPGARELFESGSAAKKLSAAVFLAPSRPECASYVVERLLAEDVSSVKPLVEALRTRLADLPDRLQAVLDHSISPGDSAADRESIDRLKARAAAALVLLGRGDRGFPRLRFTPDPQARSFLIHELGPSGVSPTSLVERLAVEPDASIRRGLIQSLGEVPRAAWDEPSRAEFVRRLLGLFENDPDSGVHGSSRWLLGRWGLDREMRAIDDRLSKQPDRPGFRWRVAPSGLTLVRVDDPALGRLIEVSDTEITVTQFLRFRPDFPYIRDVSPEPDSPINYVNYCDAAAYCNSLNSVDLIDSSEYCYRRDPVLPLVPVDGHLDRLGYRLPTDLEFESACRGGSLASRSYGDSKVLLANYARYNRGNDQRTTPVSSLKPNDFGLFGMLGNLFEICQATDPKIAPRNQSILRGLCFAHG